MSVGRKMSTICLVVLSMTVSLAANQADDFLRFIEARDESIASYEIKLRQFTFDIPLKDFVAFKKNIEQLAKNKTGSSSPLQQAEQLIQTWAKKHHWLERHTKQRGELFKETLVFPSGGTTFKSYDGRLYYRYVERNRQLDIHAKIPNVHHTNIGDLGFASGWLRRRGKILSFEQNAEGVRCVILLSEDDSLTITQQYDRNFGLYLTHFIDSRQQSDYSYYLFHEKIEGYSVPHLKINISPIPRRNECSVSMLVIEDVKFNLPLTDKDLSIQDLPSETLVIDYRFKPKIQWRYGEYDRAAVNPDAVHTGYAKPEDLLEFLKKTHGRREAFATRDSRIGQKAPRPTVQRWLSGPDGLDTWPPGKLTVINFWSIGCGFCINEIPENNDLAQWLKDQGGLFLSIHTATREQRSVQEYLENISEWVKEKSNQLASGRPAAKRPKVKDYIDSNKIHYAVGLDEPDTQRTYWGSATFVKYGVNSVPCYAIIDENGNVIAYERTVTKQKLEKLMAKKSDQITARTKSNARQRLDVIPKGWFARELQPNLQFRGRFFVFRPDTPDSDLHELESPGDAIDCQWTRHSADGQTVYEVMLTVKTPDWGQTIKGNVALVARYGNVEEMVTIPYELQSKSLAGYISNILWLEPVDKGNTISRTIMLQTDPRRDIMVKVISAPSDLQVHVLKNRGDSNRIPVECVFSSQESGLQCGTIKLLARDNEGNKQPLEPNYGAFARP